MVVMGSRREVFVVRLLDGSMVLGPTRREVFVVFCWKCGKCLTFLKKCLKLANVLCLLFQFIGIWLSTRKKSNKRIIFRLLTMVFIIQIQCYKKK